MSQYVLEWSKKQNSLIIQPIEQAFARNQECFLANVECDYTLLMVGTHDVVMRMAEHHRDKLKERDKDDTQTAVAMAKRALGIEA